MCDAHLRLHRGTVGHVLRERRVRVREDHDEAVLPRQNACGHEGPRAEGIDYYHRSLDRHLRTDDLKVEEACLFELADSRIVVFNDRRVGMAELDSPRAREAVDGFLDETTIVYLADSRTGEVRARDGRQRRCKVKYLFMF